MLFVWARCSQHSRFATSSLTFVSRRRRKVHTNSVKVPQLNHTAIEAKWHGRWAAQGSHKSAQDGHKGHIRGKYYVLPMFPYPSGALHLGHLRVYTISDVLARFRRMQGYDVVHPMGWDAFGLPAENAALERGIDPSVWTKDNIAKMKSQLISMGGHWDWDREMMTCDPDFYKHTQKIFLQLYKHGLAYQKDATVNYDPIDQTVLANEQVDSNGKSWRSGAKVEKKRLKQWFLRITAFQEALKNDLELLSKSDAWPARVLAMQRNWLGQSEGAKIKFDICSASSKERKSIETFTTRPDTLYGVQYIALSAQHSLVQSFVSKSTELSEFVAASATMPPESKKGYLIPGVFAENPLRHIDSGSAPAKEPLPIYVAPYVLDDYGEGAVMGVPGHDTRDHAFWKENAPSSCIRRVIMPANDEKRGKDDVYVQEGKLSSDCGIFGGKDSLEAGKEIVAILQRHDERACFSTTWRLRDWLISRQRYWGTPIPMVHCDNCGVVPVPESQLPVELPSVDGAKFSERGNHLENAQDWLSISCPSCGRNARRDTDTMDTFVDSSWYFMRFADPHNAAEPFSSVKIDKLLPVDIYVGGVEHAILHLLYARFLSKFFVSIGAWRQGAVDDVRGEPFKRLLAQGMVHGKTYTDPATGLFVAPERMDLTDVSAPKIKDTGAIASVSFEKMSKSKHNGVDPSSCVSKYGADVTRAHMLFQAPVEDVLEWDEGRISGIQRWLSRLWRLVDSESAPRGSQYHPPPIERMTAADVALWIKVNTTIKSISGSFADTFSLNTVVSDLTKLTNLMISAFQDGDPTILSPGIRFESVSVLLRLLAPVTPAFAEECWEVLHRCTESPRPEGISRVGSIFEAGFPQSLDDTTFTRLQKMQQQNAPTQECAVQINGKLRFTAHIPLSPDFLKSEPRIFSIPATAIQDHSFVQDAVDALTASKDGEPYIGPKGKYRAKDAKRLIVVRGGKVFNFVF